MFIQISGCLTDTISHSSHSFYLLTQIAFTLFKFCYYLEHTFRPPDAPSGSVDIQTNSATCWQNYGRSMSDHNISRISLDR